MIELKRDFTKKGIRYTQLFKNDIAVLYKCQNIEFGYKYFELFKYKTRKADRFHNDEYEVYPSDESFGPWAWACVNKEAILRELKDNFKTEDITSTYEAISKICL